MTEFEDVEVGETVTTGGRTITEADVVNHAGVSGDFNYLHTDAEKMADSPFGERIVHGSLVFSIMTGLSWQTRGTDDSVVAFYGVDELRFVQPVFIGDTIHVELEVLAVEETDFAGARGQLRQAAEVVNQDGDVVLACELLALVR